MMEFASKLLSQLARNEHLIMTLTSGWTWVVIFLIFRVNPDYFAFIFLLLLVMVGISFLNIYSSEILFYFTVFVMSAALLYIPMYLLGYPKTADNTQTQLKTEKRRKCQSAYTTSSQCSSASRPSRCDIPNWYSKTNVIPKFLQCHAQKMIEENPFSLLLNKTDKKHSQWIIQNPAESHPASLSPNMTDETYPQYLTQNYYILNTYPV